MQPSYVSKAAIKPVAVIVSRSHLFPFFTSGGRGGAGYARLVSQQKLVKLRKTKGWSLKQVVSTRSL